MERQANSRPSLPRRRFEAAALINLLLSAFLTSFSQVETVIENSRGEAAAEVAEDALQGTTAHSASEDRSPSKVTFDEVSSERQTSAYFPCGMIEGWQLAVCST